MLHRGYTTESRNICRQSIGRGYVTESSNLVKYAEVIQQRVVILTKHKPRLENRDSNIDRT
jgi:hypothetical protein